MKLSKRIGLFILAFVIGFSCITIFHFKDDLIRFYKHNILKIEEKIIIHNNVYAKNYNYNFVQITDDFYAKNYKHLLNIMFTIINSGNDSFTFYCNVNYKNCIADFEKIINDQETLSAIDNFIHPFNSFKKINTTYVDTGIITINIEKKYLNDEVFSINKKVNEILSNITKDTDSNEQKIRNIHDYIVNNSKYIDDINNYNKASAILFDGQGVCSAYTDTMTIFLSKLGLNNYKIATNNHVWNLVNIDNKWLHIDVTFDDPITNTGEDVLLHDIFLINTNELLTKNIKNHNFNQAIYLEAK